MAKKIKLTEAQERVLDNYCPITGRVGLDLKHWTKSFGRTVFCLVRDGFLVFKPNQPFPLITDKGLEYIKAKHGFFCRGHYTESLGL